MKRGESKPKEGKKKRLIPKGGNDVVMTPDPLALDIVKHFQPYGWKCLEPCKGEGAFMRAFESCGINADWCEIREGKDFFQYSGHVDWIITNPPFSILTNFLEHSLKVADNIVFICLGNAMFFKKRIRLIKQAKFGFKEIVFIDTPPKPWPQFGIQMAVVHLQRGYKGKVTFEYNGL
jgi:hypothetical protein